MDSSTVGSSPKSIMHRQPWDGFLVSPENALAHASAIALATGEGTSPLVIHGASGVGKTRLLEGLLAEHLVRKPGSSVAFLTAEAFASQCAEAAKEAAGWVQFREQFRQLDLFVLDDLQDLEQAPLALTELAHTIDALSDHDAVVAVSARTAPSQWTKLPRRLINRFIGGLAVHVQSPMLETRRRYVLDHLRVRQLTLSAAAIELLIQNTDGYRALDGLLARLALEKRIATRSSPLDPLAILSREQVTTSIVNVARIAQDVARAFGVSLRELRSASRRSSLVVPRHLAIHLAREATGASFATLGSYFGRRDAATIRYACQTSAKRLVVDPSLASLAFALQTRWRSMDNPSK
jgi:chromosomal replication initiator protein